MNLADQLDHTRRVLAESRRTLDQAGEEQAWPAFLVAMLQHQFHSAHLLMLEDGHEATIEPVGSASELAFALAASCHECLQREDSYRVQVARDTFQALGQLQELLESGEPVTHDFLAKLVLMGGTLGSTDTLLALARKGGVLEDYGEAAWLRHQVSEGPRRRKTPWREAIEMPANDFCEGKSKVSLGQLVIFAREWAAAESRAGRNVGLPATDDAIGNGIKWLEGEGRLTIPGRSEGGVKPSAGGGKG